MDWFPTGSCPAAADFGWFVGTHGALVIDVLALAMLLSSLSYRLGVRDTAKVRITLQKVLRFLTWLPSFVWAGYGFYFGSALFPCYATPLAIGAAMTIAPAVAIIMLSAANRVGRRGVRS